MAHPTKRGRDRRYHDEHARGAGSARAPNGKRPSFISGSVSTRLQSLVDLKCFCERSTRLHGVACLNLALFSFLVRAFLFALAIAVRSSCRTRVSRSSCSCCRSCSCSSSCSLFILLSIYPSIYPFIHPLGRNKLGVRLRQRQTRPFRSTAEPF